MYSQKLQEFIKSNTPETGQLDIQWNPRIEDSTLILSPRVWGEQVDAEVRVALPEPVVQLPLPNWVGVINQDPAGVHWIVSETMFVSEVEDRVLPLMGELNDILERSRQATAGYQTYTLWYNNGSVSGFYEPDPNGWQVRAATPEQAMAKVPGQGWPDRVATEFGRNPNEDPSSILARV